MRIIMESIAATRHPDADHSPLRGSGMTSSTANFDALCEALDDEYKARATYRAVIGRFGPVLPFANIVHSEQRHIDALKSLFAARGWTAPADRWNGKVAAPDSVIEACRTGVQAEIDNVALYDRLTAMTDDSEINVVFDALRRASAERHLPAFQRHLDGRGHGCGCGGGGRGGHRHQL